MKKFQKKTTPAKTTAAASGGKRKSRYAGVTAGGTGLDYFPLGDFEVEVTFYEMRPSKTTKAETFFLHGKICDAEEGLEEHVGNEHLWTQRPTIVGEQVLKSLCMALAGYDEEDEYNEFDPDAGFMDFVLDGEQNKYSEAFGDRILGRKVIASVRRGSEDGKGGHYHNITWSVSEEVERFAAPEVA